MGRGGTGLSSFASACSGAAVVSKKDRHHIAAGSLSSIALSPKRAASSCFHEVRLKTTAELGRSSGRAAIVGKADKRLQNFCTTRAHR